MNRLRHFLRNRSGATAVEYAMLAGLVSVVIITGAAALGTALSAKFVSVAGQVAAVPPN